MKKCKNRIALELGLAISRVMMALDDETAQKVMGSMNDIREGIQDLLNGNYFEEGEQDEEC